MTWTSKYKKCTNCNTSLFPHKAKGLCTKCYRTFNEMQKVDNANEIALDILRHKFLSVHKINDTKQKPFSIQKEIIQKAIKYRRLKYLELYGSIESGSINVDILKLESIFNDIAKRVTKKERFYSNGLMSYQTRHTEEQRKYIALTLLKMLV